MTITQDSAPGPRLPALRYIKPKLEPAAVDGHLYFFHDPQRPECRLFRQVAQEIRGSVEGGAVIAVTGSRAGRGTSMAAINIACALAEESRTTMVDLSVARPSLGPQLGLFEARGLVSALAGRRRDADSRTDVYMLGRRLSLVPLEAAAPPDLLDDGALPSILKDLRDTADFVIIDAPPLAASNDRETLLDLVDGVIVVASPADLASGAFETTVRIAQSVGVVGTLINEGLPS